MKQAEEVWGMGRGSSVLEPGRWRKTRLHWEGEEGFPFWSLGKLARGEESTWGGGVFKVQRV